jgi:hypothetical protein
MILLQVTNQNLLLGVMPESLGLLIFGIGLVVLTIGLRWILKRSEENAKNIEEISKTK